MKLENINHSNNKEDGDFLVLLERLEKSESSEEVKNAIKIARAMVSEKCELKSRSEILESEKAEWERERKRLIEENSTLKEQLKILRSKQFGKSSEKTRKKIEELEQKIEENEIELELKSSKKGGDKEEKSVNKARRHKLPEELEREEVIIEAPSKCPECGGVEFRKIEDDISEVLEYVPAKYKVIKYVRPRCACKNCETIVQGEAATKGIEKGKAGF